MTSLTRAQSESFGSEELGRRFWGSRRLRTVLAYGFVAVALGLAVTDVYRMTSEAGPAVAQHGRIR
ncbi:MAG TPA: hypothetical protein VMH80_13230 [Bryobacteraceae bacterium]|nr:hypothetical protein [Bryobacteraceae bacterium]